MRVTLDNIVYSLQRSGGISVVWNNIIKALQQDRSVEFNCIDYKGCMDNLCRKQLNIQNVEMRNPLLLQVSRYLSPSVKSDEPFIFHSSYYRTCNNSHATNITTVHDFTYDLFFSGLKKRVHLWQRNKAILKSKVVVCITENTKRDVLRFVPGVDESKLRVIYNGVSTDYHPLEHSKYSDYGEYAVFVGARYSYKNFKFVVDAIKTTDYKLIIVGSPLSMEEIKWLDAALGRDRYLSLSHISNKELNEVYNGAKFLAYPSSYEGFGIPVLEAQRAGCPVIAYNASSIPEVIGETPLLLNELTISEFKKKIDILKASSEITGIVQSGFENCKRFSWEKMGAEYIELYKQQFLK